MKLLTPKFLTTQIAELAVKSVIQGMMGEGSLMRHLFKRFDLHIVVLVPAMEDARAEDYPDYPNYPITPFVLYEQSEGDKEKWEHPYDSMAKCKGLQRWHGRSDERPDIIPHLLFPSDTPWSGSAKREQIVVACSGPQPWFDKMLSGMICDAIIALAHNYYYEEGGNEGIEFLE